MKRNTIVYKATCSLSKKSYIGITVFSLTSRKQRHSRDAKRGSSYIFHRALRKYGAINFSWKILCIATTYRKAQHYEKYYVKEFDTFGENGHNMTKGGEGTLGRKLSEEHKKKLLKVLKGKQVSLETRKLMSKAKIGRVLSKETRERMSKAQSAKHKDPQYLKNLKTSVPKGHAVKLSRGFIFTPSGKFYNPEEAAKFFKVCRSTVTNRCRNPKYSEWYYEKGGKAFQLQ